MNEYIIFIQEQDAIDLIEQINVCMGWPSDGTITWQDGPDIMCEFDLNTGDKIQIGYGIEIQDRIKNCLNTQQISEVFILPSNINTCVYNPLNN
jgi:hypothetical protein